MDVEMPVMDGLGAVRRIRQLEDKGDINKHIPVIAITANARQEQVAVALEAGMDEVVTKPFLVRELVPRMVALVQRFGGWWNTRELGDFQNPKRELGMRKLEARVQRQQQQWCKHRGMFVFAFCRWALEEEKFLILGFQTLCQKGLLNLEGSGILRSRHKRDFACLLLLLLRMPIRYARAEANHDNHDTRHKATPQSLDFLEETWSGSALPPARASQQSTGPREHDAAKERTWQSWGYAVAVRGR
jgi:CheY-like chemotaxis protein